MTTKKKQIADGEPTARQDEVNYPMFCDYSCEHADFADPCTVGACRREMGVWCTLKQQHNTKHARCLFRRPQ